MKKCRWCNTTENLTIDHIIPKSMGGSDEKSNKQVLCRGCHNEKERRVQKIWRNGKWEVINVSKLTNANTN